MHHRDGETIKLDSLDEEVTEPFATYIGEAADRNVSGAGIYDSYILPFRTYGKRSGGKRIFLCSQKAREMRLACGG